ncbi:MAG: iron-containing redox enzyme family protein [Tumebacillaceae bacterium]
MSIITTLEYPRLRHCTFVERENQIVMIVGQDLFEIEEVDGSRDTFFNVKRYFDGRHSIADISRITGVGESDIRGIVEEFHALGLMRTEADLDFIPSADYIRKVQDSCVMWGRQIGFHTLFGSLEKGTLRKEVFIGLLLETYHYVKAAPKHISVALAHCSNPHYEKLIVDYFIDEYNHAGLILDTLENLGVPRHQAEQAHPIIGTMSLINMLCDVARHNTFAYLACTSLFEARKEDFEAAKESFERIAANYGFDKNAVAPVIEHLRGDVEADHNSLLIEALRGQEFVEAQLAHYTVNCLHDLKHSFDQFHDQIIQYYSDISNYIPRLKVDYFSL